jgi:DNA-binding cell septation regulator SpoVG
MTLPIVITDVQFTPTSAYHRHSGLLGFLRCVVNGALAIDGITLRRTYVGDLILSFPERRSKEGKKHPIVYPRSQDARDEIERQVMAELRRQGELR